MRLPLKVTAPASGAVALRAFYDDEGEAGADETRLYASATAAFVDQPVAVAAGTTGTVYVDAPQVVWLSAKVGGVEMAGGYGTLRRYEIEGGLSRLTVEAPPAVPANTPPTVIAEVAPTGLVAGVQTIEVTGTPDGGTFTLVCTIADPDGGAARVGETAAIDFDATPVEIAAAITLAVEGAGYDGVDIADVTDDTTFTWPAVVTITVGDNSLENGTAPDVDVTEVTPGSYGDRQQTGTKWIDTAGPDIYHNYGGSGLAIDGTGTAVNWVQTSA